MNTNINKILKFLGCLNWLPPLFARITVGIVFIESGWGKLHNIDRVTQYFISLGIPFAEIQAPFVSTLEFIGGIFLVLGFLTRLTAVPLISIMTVAIITAKASDISNWTDIFSFSEFLFILLLFWLLTHGPGRISVDQRIRPG